MVSIGSTEVVSVGCPMSPSPRAESLVQERRTEHPVAMGNNDIEKKNLVNRDMNLLFDKPIK